MNMSSKANKFRIDFADNKDAAQIFAQKTPGEKCKLTIELQVNEVNEHFADATIDTITYHEHSKDKEEKEVKPDRESPVMIVMGAGKSGDAVQSY